MKQKTVTVEIHVDTTEFRRWLKRAVHKVTSRSRRKPLIHNGKKP